MGEEHEYFYSMDHTIVFWNFEMYPITNKADLKSDNFRSIKPNIVSALHEMGFHGWIEIVAYGDQLKPSEKHELYNLGIYYVEETIDMSLDIITYASTFIDKTMNIVVIAKQNPEIPDTELQRVLRCLKSRKYTVLLVETPDGTTPDRFFHSVDSIVACTRVLGGGIRKSNQQGSNIEESITPVKKGDMTGVFWDVEVYPLPVGFEPDSIYNQFVSALSDRGWSGGEVMIWAYVDEKKKESWDKFMFKKTWEAKIYFIPGGDKHARRTRMLHDIMLWVLDMEKASTVHYPHLFVISDEVRDDEEFFGRLDILSARYYIVWLMQKADHISPESYGWPGLLLDQVYSLNSESESSERSVKKQKSDAAEETT